MFDLNVVDMARIGVFALLVLALFAPSSTRRYIYRRVRSRRRQIVVGLSISVVGFWYWTRPILPDSTVRLDSSAKIFILAGQSNMAGRGGIAVSSTGEKQFKPSTSEELALLEEDESVLRLTADLRWIKAREPLHIDIDTTKVCGVGPGLVFSRVIANMVDMPRIGLVPCAVGGTKIDEWVDQGALYQSMLLRSRVAARNGNSIEGILWYQGESDAQIEDDALRYETKLIGLLKNLRRDIGAVPVLLVAISADSKILPFQDAVRAAIMRMPNLFPRMAVVDAKGLPLQPDGLHLTSEAQIVLGRKLALAFVELIASPNLPGVD